MGIIHALVRLPQGPYTRDRALSALLCVRRKAVSRRAASAVTARSGPAWGWAPRPGFPCGLGAGAAW